jgi:hypothetical protein
VQQVRQKRRRRRDPEVLRWALGAVAAMTSDAARLGHLRDDAAVSLAFLALDDTQPAVIDATARRLAEPPVALPGPSAGPGWLPAGLGPTAAVICAVVPDRAEVPAGGRLRVDVTIVAAHPVLGAECVLCFDPRLLRPVEVEAGDLLREVAREHGGDVVVWPLGPVAGSDSGHLALGARVTGAAMEAGVAGPGVLLVCHMRALDGTRGGSPLVLTRLRARFAGQGEQLIHSTVVRDAFVSVTARWGGCRHLARRQR